VPVSPASDVYGFGKTCCYALFQTPNPRRTHWESIPRTFADLLERALADHPRERYPDFNAVLKALEQVRPEGSSRRPESPAPPAHPDPVSEVRSSTDFGDITLITNPEPRLPCVLLLDVSRSMAGERIAELNEGLRAYKTELEADYLAVQRVEVAIVTFGARVDVLCPFQTADNFAPPILQAAGKTPLGEGVNRALDLLAERRQQYRANAISAFRPWVFLITDGAPTDEWHAAAGRIRQGEANKQFSFFAVGVEGADFNVLRELSVRDPLRLKGLQFRDLFLWLSTSQRSVSQSSPGNEQTVGLTSPTAPGGWASLG
jgi:uncharacterized protein YegL